MELDCMRPSREWVQVGEEASEATLDPGQPAFSGWGDEEPASAANTPEVKGPTCAEEEELASCVRSFQEVRWGGDRGWPRAHW